jgi:hypothetical protein
MFAMTYPAFIDESQFAVKSTQNPTALFIVSLIALLANVALFVYMIYRVRKTKLNPYKGELYTNLKCYEEVKAFAK